MPKPEKIAAVAEFKERVENSAVAIATQYVGIDVAQVTELRKQLREAGCEFKVYKNTLVKRALDELNLSDAAEALNGPTAWAFSPDPVTPAKILKDFAKQANMVSMGGGILGDQVVSVEKLKALADLPSREVLLAQLVGTMAAPLRNFVGVVSAVPRNFVNVLDAIKKQKEEGGE